MPFSDAQIDKMAASLAQLPPAAGQNGTQTSGDPTPAVNDAVNSILNGIAETSIHPLLFNEPSDFYLNPYITFTTTFSGAPRLVGTRLLHQGAARHDPPRGDTPSRRPQLTAPPGRIPHPPWSADRRPLQ